MRRNHSRRRASRSMIELHFDTEYTFRPDLPHIRRIIHYPRKTVYMNLEADPAAWEDMEVMDEPCEG